jgi:integrase/recombinase XerC
LGNRLRGSALAAYRDATLLKVVYGWGLRRTETSKLDLVDFGRNPAAPEFGRFGCADHPALWVTDRGGRVEPAEINARFVSYRDAPRAQGADPAFTRTG